MTTANGNQTQAVTTTVAAPSKALAQRKKSMGELLKDEFERWKPTLKAVLPAHLDADRIIKMAMGAYMRSDYLQKCTIVSVVKATIMAAELGLEVGGLLGESYLVPFDNKKKVKDGNVFKEVKVTEATLIPGYKGLVKLARQSGDVSSIYACAVDESELESFKVVLGTERKITHDMNLSETRAGKSLAYYAVIKFKDGTEHFEVMTKKMVDEIKKRSKAADSGPWQTDYDWMAKKTVLKQALKLVTMSPEKPALANAVALDNAMEGGDAFNTDIVAEFEVREEDSSATADSIAQNASPAQVPQPATRSAALSARLGGEGEQHAVVVPTPHDEDGVVK